MYPVLHDENKLLLIDRFITEYIHAGYVPTEYLQLVIPAGGLYFESDNDFDMLSQHMQLGYFSVWLHDIFAKKDIVLCPYSPYHLWALHFMYEDSLRAETISIPDFLLEERQCNLFNLYSEMHRVPMKAGQKVLSFHINIMPANIPKLVQQYPGLYNLANKRLQKISGVINNRPYRINAVCNYLVQHILSCKYIEEMAQYYLHRCCVDLFLNFALQDATPPPSIQLYTPIQTVMLHQVFNYVTTNPQMQHSVAELANMFNMPGAQLAQGFRHHFCIGITPFINMVRMMHIYDSIMQKSLTLGMIAATTGYRNTTDMLKEVDAYYECNVMLLRREQ
ncbi:hypothetical protein [Chitinophaga sp.]|uniref:hypothetical protein n=1 Tax=Chitinophaga sp. TaxID=1869181 RepID=UPI0031DCA228